MALTGIKDVDMKIIDNLNDAELGKVCQVNKYVSKLCNDEIFWVNRIRRIYPVTSEELKLAKEYLLFSSYKELYIWLQKEFRTRVGDLRRFDINFNRFKDNLNYNTTFVKFLEIFSNKWTSPVWINKEEFLIYLRRVLFKVFRKNENMSDMLADHVYQQIMNRDFSLPIYEITRDHPEIFPQ